MSAHVRIDADGDTWLSSRGTLLFLAEVDIDDAGAGASLEMVDAVRTWQARIATARRVDTVVLNRTRTLVEIVSSLVSDDELRRFLQGQPAKSIRISDLAELLRGGR